MGLDYWLVHLTWTIPPAAVLTFAYWPFFTTIEVRKLWTLIFIAVSATIPWDSYLVRSRIWGYPADAVCGFTIFQIPVEEVFFFIIQSYSTGLLYTILTKHLVLPTYLLPRHNDFLKQAISLFLLSGSGVGVACIYAGANVTYLGLILAWALPVITFQWFLCGSFLLSMPAKPILISVWLPTAYLWMVDALSLKRGTWVIGDGTKLGLHLGKHLDVEEALFFLVSNVMIVIGLIAMDHAIAISEYNVVIAKSSEEKPRTFNQMALSYVTTRQQSLDLGFLEGMSKAIDKLAQKSQSMYLGSAMFQGRLRIDLILLYSFCRVVDDLVDEAPDSETARANVKETSQVLHWRFSSKRSTMPLYDYLESERPDSRIGVSSPLITSIAMLPVSRLSITPLLELLSGFEMDLEFNAEKGRFPITTEEDLEVYAYRVAGTVAASLLELVFAHYGIESPVTDSTKQAKIIRAGEKMGQALQYVNIARDIKHDAAISRVYIPTSWLAEEGMTPEDVIANPEDPKLAVLEERILQKADVMHNESVATIDELPHQARGPVKTTVESYMMIGEMVRERRRTGMPVQGKLKVPLWRRLGRAWREMLWSN